MNLFKPPTLLLSFFLISFTMHTAQGANPAADKREISKEIKSVNKTLKSKQGQYNQLADQVKKLEQNLGDITKKHRQTEIKIETAQQRLKEAIEKSQELDTELERQTAALAQQLQAMYTAGEQSHLRLLLRQDDPSDISRTFRYYDYLNRHRTDRIEKIQQTKNELKASREKASKEREQLNGLNKELAQQKQAIAATLGAREEKLGTMKKDIRSNQKRLSQLKKEEAELDQVLKRLERKRQQEAERRARAQEAARKAAQAAQAAKQKQAQAAAQAARQRQAQAAAQANQTARQQRAQANQAAQAAKQRQAQAAQAARQRQAQAAAQAAKAKQQAAAKKAQQKARGPQVSTSFTPNKPFAKLRGKLSWPANGRILHKYRSRRNEKQRWNGVVIQAKGGAPVKSVAAGRVAFAGWMNGYGHLIIIEHDRNYISLYGYNRAIYKREGQVIRANEVIASVGNSGGQSQNALYFEIRKGTAPQNPARWCR